MNKVTGEYIRRSILLVGLGVRAHEWRASAGPEVEALSDEVNDKIKGLVSELEGAGTLRGERVVSDCVSFGKWASWKAAVANHGELFAKDGQKGGRSAGAANAAASAAVANGTASDGDIGV